MTTQTIGLHMTGGAGSELPAGFIAMPELPVLRMDTHEGETLAFVTRNTFLVLMTTITSVRRETCVNGVRLKVVVVVYCCWPDVTTVTIRADPHIIMLHRHLCLGTRRSSVALLTHLICLGRLILMAFQPGAIVRHWQHSRLPERLVACLASRLLDLVATSAC